MIQQLGLLCDHLPPLWAILVQFPLQKTDWGHTYTALCHQFAVFRVRQVSWFLLVPVTAPAMTCQDVIRKEIPYYFHGNLLLLNLPFSQRKKLFA